MPSSEEEEEQDKEKKKKTLLNSFELIAGKRSELCKWLVEVS